MSKRPFTALLTAGFLPFVFAPGLLLAMDKGAEKPPQTQTGELRPGDYVWNPPPSSSAASAPGEGSVAVVVSLKEQKLWVYRNGAEIGRSTISSGRQGYETPAGVYMILEKNVSHRSNKYNEASMPYMERLTWDGLAIHAGNVPDHPESHGCLHVPLDFAKKLFSLTQEGDSVLIADGAAKPQTTTGPNALFPGKLGAAAPASSPTPSSSPKSKPSSSPSPAASPTPNAAAPPPFVWKPEASPTGPLLIVFSTADRILRVSRKGVQIGQVPLGGGEKAGRPAGNHLYVATEQKLPNGKPKWSLLGKGDGSSAPDFGALSKRWKVPAGLRDPVRDLIGPGTALVLTDQSAASAKPPTGGGPKTED